MFFTQPAHQVGDSDIHISTQIEAFTHVDIIQEIPVKANKLERFSMYLNYTQLEQIKTALSNLMYNTTVMQEV